MVRTHLKWEEGHITREVRQLNTWEKTVANDLKTCGLEEEQAQDMQLWRLAISRPDLTMIGKRTR